MKKRIFSLLTFIMLICVSFVMYYYFISKELVVTKYRIEVDISNELRIVQLTDLHNAEFGRNNNELVELVELQKPDCIVMTGDMLNRDNEKLDIVIKLILQLNEIAPVYFGYGNHEYSLETTWNRDLHEELSNTEAVVLNNEFVDVDVKGNSLRIGGYMGYYRQPGMFPVDEEQRALELAFADDFENTDRLKILLNHIPTQWVDWGYVDKYPVDIVFSGHFHGGMIRIPFIDRGIYAPYVGFFPEFTKGIYEGSQATCILSAGLGSEHMIPRLNNPSEIVVVDLLPHNN